MEELERELDETRKVLSRLRPPELPGSRIGEMRRASLGAFSKRWRRKTKDGFRPYVAELVEAMTISGLGGIYLAWAALKTAALLGLV